MNGSASPKPARGPVFGLTWPILITFACALAELALSSAGLAMAAAPGLIIVRRSIIRFISASLSFRPHPEEARSAVSKDGQHTQPLLRAHRVSLSPRRTL